MIGRGYGAEGENLDCQAVYYLIVVVYSGLEARAWMRVFCFLDRKVVSFKYSNGLIIEKLLHQSIFCVLFSIKFSMTLVFSIIVPEKNSTMVKTTEIVKCLVPFYHCYRVVLREMLK